MDSTQPSGWRAWLAHAFAVDKYDESSLAAEEKVLLTRLALDVHAKGMATPAILFIQANRHMNWLASQAMVIAEPLYDIAHPFVGPLLKRFGLQVSPAEMIVLISAFEKRFSLEYFVQRIEAAQAGELELEKIAIDDSEIVVVDKTED